MLYITESGFTRVEPSEKILAVVAADIHGDIEQLHHIMSIGDSQTKHIILGGYYNGENDQEMSYAIRDILHDESANAILLYGKNDPVIFPLIYKAVFGEIGYLFQYGPVVFSDEFNPLTDAAASIICPHLVGVNTAPLDFSAHGALPMAETIVVAYPPDSMTDEVVVL